MHRWQEFRSYVFKPSTFKGQRIHLELMIIIVVIAFDIMLASDWFNDEWREHLLAITGFVVANIILGIFMSVRMWNLLGQNEQELLNGYRVEHTTDKKEK